MLLLDEIAGGLTDDEVQVLVEEIKAIRAEGVSLIWIEHVVHQRRVVDRLVVINFGTLLRKESRTRSLLVAKSRKSTWGSKHESVGSSWARILDGTSKRFLVLTSSKCR